MKASIIGRIRNTNLPRSKALLPLFEAVVNSFHAIEEVPDHPNALIRIEATRERLLDNDELADFESFAVIDNGSGFNDNNYESFETVDTQYKHALGGKGLGHFSWLKAFDHVKIDSHYRNGDGLKHRAFDFLPLEDEAEAFPEPSSEAEPRTPCSAHRLQITRELAAILERRLAAAHDYRPGVRDWVFPSPTSATGHVQDTLRASHPSALTPAPPFRRVHGVNER